MQYKRERMMFVKYNINIAITQPDYCCFRVLLKSMTVRLRKSSGKRNHTHYFTLLNVMVDYIR